MIPEEANEQSDLEGRVASLENLCDSLKTQCESLRNDYRHHEKLFDTFILTPLWKRIIFLIDGWSGHEIVKQPQWRPWRRWWRS